MGMRRRHAYPLCLCVLSAVLVVVFLYCYHVHSLNMRVGSDSGDVDSSVPRRAQARLVGLSSGHAPQLPHLVVPLATQEEKTFTVVIQTYQRLNLLRRLLPHYCNMSCVDRILVVWNNVNVSVPQELSEMPCSRAGLIFLPMQRNSVRNRFQPFPEIRTKGKQERSCVWAFYLYP